ncbi:MAG TPA: phytanoyl-CoA dioxygenase family protein [Chthonomonadaceae bacterium]|nr:phytanoyl-CoA dioxygenase family protein [Chthonomonadaceae bacterium]
MDPTLELFNDEQIAAYHREGYLVVPDLLTDAEVEAFLTHEQQRSQPANFGLQGHRTDPQYGHLATHPKVLAGVRQLLCGSPSIVQTMLLNKRPQGGQGIALHQDSHYLPNEPNTLMACWLALTDTDPSNGGLCVVPGSHREGLRSAHRTQNSEEHASWETEHTMSDRNGRQWTQKMVSFEIDDIPMERLVRLTVPRGAGVFFTGMTIHGSFANRSEARPRVAFATHYIHADTWLFREDVQNPMPVE